MKYHPVANIFPMIEGAEYDALVADIKENGLHESIWLYEDKILDGRNRARACKDAGVEIKTREYKGKDPLGFVISLNLKRRHLNESQRAMIAARIATMSEGRPEKTTAQNCAVSQTDAAERMAVSRRTVQSARVVQERGTPELSRAVDSGKMPVSVAARLTKATPEKQREVVKDFESNATATEKKAHVALATGENEWYTPPEYVKAVREVMGGIDCDPASSEKANRTVKADTFFTIDDDGLSQKWSGRVFCNPPYAPPLIGQFSAAIVKKFKAGEIDEACILVNNATETVWFQSIAECSSAVCFPKSRVRFLDPAGNPGAPLQGQAVIYLGKKSEVFCRVFGKFGTTWSR
jgi:ParB family chromosome partitioning protein